jgi:hypothetical protein
MHQEQKICGIPADIAVDSITLTDLTASKPVFTDANKKLVSTGTLGIDQGGTGVTVTDVNHEVWVDSGRTDSYTVDGSKLRPYKTLLAAITAINADSVVHAAAADYAGTNYVVHVAAGTYSDNLTFNNQKYIKIEGNGVIISGTIALTQTQQSGDYYSRIEFIGVEGTRAEKGPALKLAGNITMTRNNDSLTYVTFKGCWITGNILADTDGTWILHFNGSHVAGTIDTGTFADADSAILIETTGWNEFAGAITDKVSFYNVDNAEFYGVINTTPVFDSRITNSRFGAAVTINAKNLYIDDISYKSLLAQTETLAGATVVKLDTDLITAGSGTGVTIVDAGSANQTLYKVTTTYAAYSDSDTKKGIVIATLPIKTKILSCYADTTAAYTGGTVSAATLVVGVTAEDAAEIIASHDVFAGAVTKGLADADMGTGMTRAAAIQGGYLPSWTGTTAIYATINTTDGNTNALTAGSTTFYLITERY